MESSALPNPNVNIRTKTIPLCCHVSQLYFHLIRAIVALCPNLSANWSGPICDFGTENTSFLWASLSFEIGLSCLHVSIKRSSFMLVLVICLVCMFGTAC